VCYTTFSILRKCKAKRHPVPYNDLHRKASWGTAHSILNPALGVGVWLMLRPRPLTPGKEPWYVLYNRLIRPQGRDWRVSTRRKSLSSTRFRTPDRPVCSESLYRQHYPGSLQNCKVIIFIIFMLLPLFLLGLIWLIPFKVSK